MLGILANYLSLISRTLFSRRLAKEAGYYEKEVKENEGKLAKMKADGRDPYDIKKFEEVLGESYMMVPDSKARLKKALEDLSLFLKNNSNVLDPESESMSEAKSIVATHSENDKETNDVDETKLDDLEEGEDF
uniref:Tubulin-specific chaperone A n=2 Tax=Ditylum brightwellii TaxID=49249 RepID=A0A6V2H5K8_9STRA|mmetsp:Transcript_13277/g.19333  ORF Transcript_13277/g.19333 Transcript_13277/m.19333 type:complete len:133 (+) Transcript_13277:451-849(+)